MKVTVQNLTNKMLSTDVGLLNPAESKTLEMGPDAAYRAAEGLKSLSDLGYVLVTIAEEPNKLDDLEPAAVGTASVADGTVTTVKLDDEAVTTAKLALLAVDDTILAADAVTTAKIADANVTAAKMAMFVSTEETGTGSPQNVAHGLGGTPTVVLVGVTEDPTGTGFDVAEGAHDGTNVVLTVTSGVKFKVLAML